MSHHYELTDLQAEATKLSGNPRALVFCDDEGYSLFISDYLILLPLGRTPEAAMKKLRRFHARSSSEARKRGKTRCNPELFTNIRLHLMLARFEIVGAVGSGARDIHHIFSDLCSLDNKVIKAQKTRGFNDNKVLDQLRKLALARRQQKRDSDDGETQQSGG